MRIETALNVIRIENNQQVTTRYEQWVNPHTNKHEQRVIVYSVDLYTNKGQSETYTNGRRVDQLV